MKTKTKKITALFAFLCLFMLNNTVKAQFTLQNNLSCDVTVNIEVGDISNCPVPASNNPCNWYTVTIPANMGMHTVVQCGPIHELCITVLDIGGTTISGCHTNNSVPCCMTPNVFTAACPVGCSLIPGTASISRTATNWTIN